MTIEIARASPCGIEPKMWARNELSGVVGMPEIYRVTEGLTTAETTVGEKGNKNATMLGFSTVGVLNNWRNMAFTCKMSLLQERMKLKNVKRYPGPISAFLRTESHLLNSLHISEYCWLQNEMDLYVDLTSAAECFYIYSLAPTNIRACEFNACF